MPRLFRIKMITFDVKFQCDMCGQYVIRPVRFTSNFMVLMNELPEGWKLDVRMDLARVFCPKHAKDAK